METLLLLSKAEAGGLVRKIKTAVVAAHDHIEQEVSTPYAVCPTCQGRGRDACASCKGRGFVSKLHFDTCVPEELKAVRAKSCVVL